MSSLSLSAVLQIVDEASKPLKLIKQLSNGGADSIDDLTKSIDRLNRKLGGADADRFNKSLKETEKILTLLDQQLKCLNMNISKLIQRFLL